MTERTCGLAEYAPATTAPVQKSIGAEKMGFPIRHS